jgi:hypothetical protein
MSSTEEILIQLGTDEAFDHLFNKVKLLTRAKTTGIVVVVNSYDAFIDSVVLNVVSPQIPYMGHIRDTEGLMELHHKSEEGLYICSLHLIKVSPDSVFARLEEYLENSDIENKKDILNSLKEKMLLIVGQGNQL